MVMVVLSINDVMRCQEFLNSICEDLKNLLKISIVGAFQLPGDEWTHVLTTTKTGYSFLNLNYDEGSDIQLSYDDIREYRSNIRYLNDLPSDAKPVAVTLASSDLSKKYTYFWSPHKTENSTFINKDGKEADLWLDRHWTLINKDNDPGAF